jgi:hypothetical protein
LAKTTPPPCHSEASFIGEESAFCQPRKQQIPRAIMPRFGMTILWGFSNYTTTPIWVVAQFEQTSNAGVILGSSVLKSLP